MQASSQCFAHTLHDGRTLYRLTGDIQGQIFAINHTLDETEVGREELLRLLKDEHLARVESHLPLNTPLEEATLALSWDEEDAVQIDRYVGREVNLEQWLISLQGQLAVEVLVLLSLYLAGGTPPEGLTLVELPLATVDREGYKVGVALDDLLKAPACRKLLRVILQVQSDRRSPLLTLRRANLVVRITHTLPHRCLSIGTE